VAEKRVPKPKIRIVVPIVEYDRVKHEGKVYKADRIILKDFTQNKIRGEVQYKYHTLFEAWFNLDVFEERVYLIIDGVPIFIGTVVV
jgi:hypothetical protein